MAILKYSDLSNNKLQGDVPVNGSFSLFTPIRSVQIIIFLSCLIVDSWPEALLMPCVPLYSYQNNPDLKQPKNTPAPLSPPAQTSSGSLMSVFYWIFSIVKE